MYKGLEDTPWPWWCYFPHITYSTCLTLGPISVAEVELFPQLFMFKHKTNIEAGAETPQ